MTGWTYPRIIAHRCGGALAPENTLAGLRIAARMGLRAVEFDVMLSADGLPVLIHDETLERTTSGHGQVARQTAEQLRKLDAGSHHHRAFAGEPLPTLREALETCRVLGLAANVEIKPACGHDVKTGAVVAQTVASFLSMWGSRGGAELPLLLSSFSHAALDAARIATTLSGAPARALLFESVPDDWFASLTHLDCRSLHCAAHLLLPDRLRELQAAGVQVACYTVNDPEQAQRLFSDGVASVFSDRIDLFSRP